MALGVGDRLPSATLSRMGDNGPEAVSLDDLSKGRKIVIFGLPGAFTGTCSTSHVPSFMRNKDALMAKGVDEIICISVNDPFVMEAWGKDTGAAEAGLTFLADHGADFTKAMGRAFTAPPVGFFDRSQRYAMCVSDGEITVMNDGDEPGVCDMSSGETMLEKI